ESSARSAPAIAFRISAGGRIWLRSWTFIVDPTPYLKYSDSSLPVRAPSNQHSDNRKSRHHNKRQPVPSPPAPCARRRAPRPFAVHPPCVPRELRVRLRAPREHSTQRRVISRR